MKNSHFAGSYSHSRLAVYDIRPVCLINFNLGKEKELLSLIK